MKIRCFTIPTQDPEPAETELNAFLAGHRIGLHALQAGYQAVKSVTDRAASRSWRNRQLLLIPPPEV
ncbi:MAG: hypothetical protein QNK37_38655 [Acidobacteriota bacterium]|nr:hypothetical protein [Acidobacteriota bacterium]